MDIKYFSRVLLGTCLFFWMLPTAIAGDTDTDSDGISDAVDNCLNTPNADQRDTNSDGFGNLCDPDLDNNGTVDFTDLSLLKAVFFTADADADLDDSGTVDFPDLSIMKSFFFGQPGPTGVIVWISETDGDWATPENWQPLGPPQPENRVLISVDTADPVITISSQDVEIFSIDAQEALVIGDGRTLSITGEGTLQGPVTLGDDATLEARSNAAMVSVSGTPALGDGNLLAAQGGTLSLEDLTAFDASTDQRTWTATGTDSLLSLPALTSISVGATASATLRWDMVSDDGGSIDLPALSTIAPVDSNNANTRTADILIDGGNVSVPLLTLFDNADPNARSKVVVENGGTLSAPLLSSLTLIELDIDETAVVDLDQITHFDDGQLIVSARVQSMPNLTEIGGSSIRLVNGAQLQLPAVLSVINDKDLTLWEAEDASTLAMPNLTSLTNGDVGNSASLRLDVRAESASLINLVALDSVQSTDSGTANSRNIEFFADGTGSVVNLPALTSFEDLDESADLRSLLSALNGGSIELPLITEYDFVSLIIDDPGAVDINQVTAWTDSVLQVRGTSVVLPNLTNIDDAELTVSDGGLLRLPNVASYSVNRDITDWIAEDTGSELALPNLLTLTVGDNGTGNVRMDIEGRDGGVVNLPLLNTISVVDSGTANSRNVEVIADGPGSTVALPALSTFSDLDFSSSSASVLQATNGGTIDMPLITAFDNLSVTTDGSSTVNISQITSWTNSVMSFAARTESLPALTDITNTEIMLEQGAVLTLAGITTVTADVDLIDWRVEDAGSHLQLPNLIALTIGGVGTSGNVRMDIDAVLGGVVDMPALTDIVVTDSGSANSRNLEIFVDGTDSAVEMPLLSTFEDNDLSSALASSVSALNNGRVEMPLLIQPLQVDLTVDATADIDITQITRCNDCMYRFFDGTFALPNLTTFDNSTAEAIDGASLTLTNLATATMDRDNRTWLAEGVGSTLSLPALLVFEVGEVASGTNARVDVEALDGGVIDLPLLSTITVVDSANASARNLEMLADESGSVIDMPSLVSFADNDAGPLASTITQTDGGLVNFPGAAVLTNVIVSP